jgi:hypothetical protein
MGGDVPQVFHKAKEAAYRTLISGGVSSLPVDIIHISKASGISTIMKNSAVCELSDGEYATITFNGSIWRVVYDDSIQSCEVKRLILAHEIGRKALRHDRISPQSHVLRRSSKITVMPQEEREANAFARYLLAPLVVLCMLGLKSSADIAAICHIPIETAEHQAELLEHYRAAAKPLNRLEAQLYGQLKGFIEDCRT